VRAASAAIGPASAAGSGIGLGLLDPRPDLRTGFLTSLIGGILQMGDLLLQGVNVLPQTVRLSNAVPSGLIPRRAWPLTAQARLLLSATSSACPCEWVYRRQRRSGDHT
jgi:hypothetical protein